MSVNVQVAVRTRPLIEKEKREGCSLCVETVSDRQLLVGTKSYSFSAVFGPEADQGCVYDATVGRIVNNLFLGHNVTVFAYGQTGSGKTFTMGTNETPETFNAPSCGIIPRALKDVFGGISERSDSSVFTVKASYVELYMEVFRDLLVGPSTSSANTSDTASIVLREGPPGFGPILVGACEQQVTNFLELMDLISQGNERRAVAATAMNAASSRSHAILIIALYQHPKHAPEDVTLAKFRLVDLAGSESAKRTGAVGDRLQEGIKINRSLLALGNVIEQAVRGQTLSVRDSKLTRLLQDSFGGNAHTLMLACVSPADSNMHETVSTLRYAERAQLIKNRPTENRDPTQALIAALKEENAVLRARLKLLESSAVLCSQNVNLPAESAAICSVALAEKLDRRTFALPQPLDWTDGNEDSTGSDEDDDADVEVQNDEDEQKLVSLTENVRWREQQLAAESAVSAEDVDRAASIVAQLEADLLLLKNEKARLEAELHSKANKERVGEDRRKKLKELEDRLFQTTRELEKAVKERETLKRKQEEYERKSVENAKALLEAKRARVELMKKLSDESKSKREQKEMLERRLQGAVQEKMKVVQTHQKLMSKQESENNFLKAKLAQTQAAIKRLRDAEQRRKEASQLRPRFVNHGPRGRGGAEKQKNPASEWVDAEMEGFVAKLLMKSKLDELIANRKEVVGKRDNLQDFLHVDGENLDPALEDKIRGELGNLDLLIGLHSAQITALNAETQSFDVLAPMTLNAKKLDEFVRTSQDGKRMVNLLFQRLVAVTHRAKLSEEAAKLLKERLEVSEQETAAAGEEARKEKRRYCKVMEVLKRSGPCSDSTVVDLDSTKAADAFVSEFVSKADEENADLWQKVVQLQREKRELAEKLEESERKFKVAANYNLRQSIAAPRSCVASPILVGGGPSPLGALPGLAAGVSKLHQRGNLTHTTPGCVTFGLPVIESSEALSDEEDKAMDEDDEVDDDNECKWKEEQEDEDEGVQEPPAKKASLDEIVMPTPKPWVGTGCAGMGRTTYGAGFGDTISVSTVAGIGAPPTPGPAFFSPSSPGDDHEKDPDWHATPLQKRLSAAQHKNKPQRLTLQPAQKKDKDKCECKGNCSKKLCGCRKKGQPCSWRCLCVSCVNDKGAAMTDPVPENLKDEDASSEDSQL